MGDGVSQRCARNRGHKHYSFFTPSMINSVYSKFQVVHIQNVFCILQSVISLWLLCHHPSYALPFSLTEPPAWATHNFPASSLVAHSLPVSQSSLKYKSDYISSLLRLSVISLLCTLVKSERDIYLLNKRVCVRRGCVADGMLRTFPV